jgi:hypothetical protein
MTYHMTLSYHHHSESFHFPNQTLGCKLLSGMMIIMPGIHTKQSFQMPGYLEDLNRVGLGTECSQRPFTNVEGEWHGNVHPCLQITTDVTPLASDK